MGGPAEPQRPLSSAYELFILVLTILSLAVMAILILPVSESTEQLLSVYDNVICVVFLFDFSLRLRRASPKRSYFLGERGWLDLLGSVPNIGGVFKYAALLRLARLSRLARISRLLRGKGRRALAQDVLHNRGQYAAIITLLSGLVVLIAASVLVLQFDSRSGDANITTGGDALWWSIVTITTVGYGDLYPVSTLGRVTAAFVMLAGVGIIGALASILASILVPPPEGGDAGVEAPAIGDELAELKAELAALRRAFESSGIGGA
jgi:voltage-gated potassium channel